MKSFKGVFLALILLAISNAKSQESAKTESLREQIIISTKSIEESNKRIELLNELIKELEKSGPQFIPKINEKNDEIKILKLAILENQLNIYKLKEQLPEQQKQIFTETDNAESLDKEDINYLKTIKDNVIARYEHYITNEEAKKAFANTTIIYRALIFNTNFTVPIARFNLAKNDDENKIGDILLFNSIGAGFGMSGGRMTETRDVNGNLVNSEFSNTFGVHLGFLFSASSGEENKNVFAPTLSVSILDFQLGYGYELGSITDNQSRSFITLGYAIPLYKLTKGKFRYVRRHRILNEVTTFNDRKEN